MAGVAYKPGYYKSRLWDKLKPPSSEQHLKTVQGHHNNLAIKVAIGATANKPTPSFVFEDAIDELEVDPEEVLVNWDQTFEAISYSNKKLYELLPPAIAAAEGTDQDWDSPASFPEPVSDWWRGQKHILFYQSNFQKFGLDDVVLVLNDCQQFRQTWQNLGLQNVKDVDKSLLRQVVLEIMRIQKELLEKQGRLDSKYANLLHNCFDGQLIRLKCRPCGSGVGETKNPVYSTNRPNHVVDLFKLMCRSCSSRSHSIPLGEDVL